MMHVEIVNEFLYLLDEDTNFVMSIPMRLIEEKKEKQIDQFTYEVEE